MIEKFQISNEYTTIILTNPELILLMQIEMKTKIKDNIHFQH
jgi:hypothetical protein